MVVELMVGRKKEWGGYEGGEGFEGGEGRDRGGMKRGREEGMKG
jgi:hypothetical protein